MLRGDHEDQWSFSKRSSKAQKNALFQYPAMMVADMQRDLVEALLDDAPENPGPVFDPFIGSGTILSAGMTLGRDVVGWDVNPLAILICRVKAGPFHLQAFADAADRQTVSIDRHRHAQPRRPGRTQGVDQLGPVAQPRVEGEEPSVGDQQVAVAMRVDPVERVGCQRKQTVIRRQPVKQPRVGDVEPVIAPGGSRHDCRSATCDRPIPWRTRMTAACRAGVGVTPRTSRRVADHSGYSGCSASRSAASAYVIAHATAASTAWSSESSASYSPGSCRP